MGELARIFLATSGLLLLLVVTSLVSPILALILFFPGMWVCDRIVRQ